MTNMEKLLINRGYGKKTGDSAPSDLGPLESEVMEQMWREDQPRREASVREIYLIFNKRLAYTTLMTTLDRLYKKGLLERRKAGRAFLYSPRLTQAQYQSGIARSAIESLLDRQSADASPTRPVLSCIVDAVSERDRSLLDELDRLVKEKRRELKEKD